MPNVYQTVFGGSLVAPAIPTYLSLPISANVILGWPLESNITSPAAAEIIDVTASVGALTVQLSDARQVGTGYCALFNNVGANTFSVLDAQGNVLMAPTSGQAWQLYLADNSTLQGTWRVFQYGAGVSNANAATLAGSGLKAIATTLNERIVINPQATNYVILTADRAACVEWTGGSGGTFTAPAAAAVGSDWFCYIKNSGTGVLTLSGTIDGSAGKSFNPNDSCILVSDGTNLFTLGFGQSVASSFNFVTISLAGATGTVILNGAQLNRISYKFTGALAGNVTVQVPASIQQYWIDNETTGAFTLTISAGGAGATVVVPQATRTILYCDGLNIVNAISSGAIQFADGTAAAPSITFASDPTIGFYKAGAGALGISTAGVSRGVINATGQWNISTGLTVNGVVAAADGTSLLPSITFASDLTMGLYRAGAGILGIATSAVQRATLDASGHWGFFTPSSGTGATLGFQNTGVNPGIDINNNNSVVGNPLLRLLNANASAQTCIDFFFGGGSTLSGRFRNGFNGSMNYASFGTGAHDFFTGGDSGVGQISFAINASAPFVQGFGPVAAALVDMTPDTSTFTGTIVGCTTSPTITVSWSRVGRIVTLNMPHSLVTAVSNSAGFSLSGVPAALRPATSLGFLIPIGPMQDNGAEVINCFAGTPSVGGIVNFYKGSAVAANWTNVGNKSIGSPSGPSTGISITYSLD